MGDDWFQTPECHAAFLGRCKKGHEFQVIVASYLAGLGLAVTVSGLLLRKEVSTEPFDDGGDIQCEGMDVEVKSTRFPFITPSDFRFPAPMIDSVASFENSKKDKNPVAYIVFSAETKAMMFIPVEETRDKWFVVDKRDMNLDRRTKFYQCPKEYWQTIDGFKEFILSKRYGNGRWIYL
jgi:hypothetical protein